MVTATNKFTRLALATTLATTLAACGGGGGAGGSSSGTIPVASGFPVQQALSYAFTHGMQANLAITGTASSNGASYPISGNLTYTLSTASSATFEGASVTVATEMVKGNITVNGQSTPLQISDTLYLNGQYAPIASTSPGNYCVANGAASYPATATVGQSGDIVTMNCYTDSTKRNLINVEKVTYITATGSEANSIDFKMVTTDYGLGSTPVSSNSTTYTISAAGIPKLTRLQAAQTDSGVTVTFEAH